jgi:hypothetical protein
MSSKKNRVRRGKLVSVKNKAGKFGASRDYVFTFLDNLPYLFTKAQLDVARDRAKKNPEDLLPRKKFFFF